METVAIEPISLEDAKKIGDEYGRLMILPTLCDQQEARMDEILQLATLHGNVDFWISHAACDRGADIGLLSPASLHNIENQRAILREQLALTDTVNPMVEATLNQQITATKRQAIEKLAGHL